MPRIPQWAIILPMMPLSLTLRPQIGIRIF
jgi:hypothetical protein